MNINNNQILDKEDKSNNSIEKRRELNDLIDDVFKDYKNVSSKISFLSYSITYLGIQLIFIFILFNIIFIENIESNEIIDFNIFIYIYDFFIEFKIFFQILIEYYFYFFIILLLFILIVLIVLTILKNRLKKKIINYNNIIDKIILKRTFGSSLSFVIRNCKIKKEASINVYFYFNDKSKLSMCVYNSQIQSLIDKLKDIAPNIEIEDKRNKKSNN